MDIDIATVSVMTAIVVITAGVIFIVETVLREDDAVGRVWSIAFLSGILASVSYALWAFAPDTWGAVAVGNAAFVGSAGFMWLGCRKFNERRIGWAEGTVVAITLAVGAAVIVHGPEGGGWAGAEVMFAGLFVLPAAAAVETVRGTFVGIRTAIGLTLVFGIQSLYYLGRLVVFLTAGPESDTFTVWWGTIPTSVLTIVLTLVVVVTGSVLRAERADLRGRRRLSTPTTVFTGVLDRSWFERFLGDAIGRAASARETVAVISTRIDDLATVTTAFGASEAESLRVAWQDAVRRHGPTQSWAGDDAEGGIVLSTVVESQADARRIAARLHRSINDALTDVEASVIPVLGVGVATCDSGECDAANLITVARAAAREAMVSDDASVVVTAVP